MTPYNPLRTTRGMAMITVLLLLSVVSILLLSVATLTRHNTGTFLRREKVTMASYAAESGLRHALAQLSADPNWSPGAAFANPLPTDPRLSYEVEVVNNFSGGAPATSPGGSVPPGQVWLRSTGLVDGEPLSGGFGRAQSFVSKPDVTFDDAVYERNQDLHPKSAQIDCYNTDPVSPFSPGFVPSDPTTALIQANLRSDTSVHLMNSNLDGNIIVPDDTKAVQMTGGSTMTGAVIQEPEVPLKQKFSKPPIFDGVTPVPAPSSGLITPGCYSRMAVPSGGTVQFERDGLYYFQSVTLGDNAILELVDPGGSPNGTCVVYVGDQFVAGLDCSINSQLGPPLDRPRDFQLYTCDERTDQAGQPITNVNFGENTVFTGVISGLGCKFKSSPNAEFFGAINANTTGWDPGFTVHYDMSLQGSVLEGDAEWVLINRGRDD